MDVGAEQLTSLGIPAAPGSCRNVSSMSAASAGVSSTDGRPASLTAPPCSSTSRAGGGAWMCSITCGGALLGGFFLPCGC